jgi:hypothetical protein
VIDPKTVALYRSAGLKRFKLQLFDRIGASIEKLGGRYIPENISEVAALPDEVIPIIGCQPESTELISQWRKTGRKFIYWDRGYYLRWFATSLPKPPTIEQSYYRWHVNSFQMKSIANVSDARWKSSGLGVKPWNKNGRHIVIAAPSKTYMKFHRCESWLEDTLDALARITDRQIVIRHKEQVLTRPLSRDVEGAHCLVAHASIAAVESVIYGCPVFVHPDSAAALVGKTNLQEIEKPIYPERDAWLHSLAANQWCEKELVDGTLWREIT